MQHFSRFEDGERKETIVEGIHFKRIKHPVFNNAAIVKVVGTDPETGEDITVVTAEPGTLVVGHEEDTFEPPIPEGFIPITTAEQSLYSSNMYVRGEDGKPIEKPPYTPTLEEVKTRKWNSVRIERDRLEQAGVPYLEKMLDSDTVSVQRIAIAVQAAQAAIAANVPFTLAWTMQDNTAVEMDAAQVVGMSVALAQYSDSLHQTARALREQIEAAETAEELEFIKWPE
ncbi:DUF4376 domain-containing protein [Anaerospora hongkongensis]|uniref:DUF4376 domain-containing protein n=1 Tax=Anaerospora hongkongensis TaxID=244830 RepID=UPI0028992759|nr:DUF4376 domain-containing protein [Anaerospora hongkongensis]